MVKKADKVQLILNVPPGFNINITLGDKTYHVQTEHGGTQSPVLTTRIYHKGEILYSKNTDYSDLLNEANPDETIKNLMDRQHKLAIEEFTKNYSENRKKIQYFDTVKKLLLTKNHKQALKILKDAMAESPDDPFIMSYYGYLRAVVEKRYDEGIKICQRALKEIQPPVSPEEKSLHSSFYLNLGKAYMAGGEKKAAMDALKEGLSFDKTNRDLLWELRKLGVRKKPPIPFLPRDNFINKYLGKLLSKLKA